MTKNKLMDAVKNFLESEQLKYIVSGDEDCTGIRVFVGQKEICFSFYRISVTIATYYDVEAFKSVTLSRMQLYYEELGGVRGSDHRLFINMAYSASFLTVYLGQSN